MTIIMIFKKEKLPYSSSALYSEKHILYITYRGTMMRRCLNSQTLIYVNIYLRKQYNIYCRTHYYKNILYIYIFIYLYIIANYARRDKCVSYKHYAYVHVQPGVPLFLGRKWRSYGYYNIGFIVS